MQLVDPAMGKLSSVNSAVRPVECWASSQPIGAVKTS